MRPTALLRASEDGDTELVRKLLQDGLDIEMRHRGSGRTPLLEAVIGGHLATAELLIAEHADIEARDTAVGYAALAWAVTVDQAPLVRLLLDHEADVDSRNGIYDVTPLILAAQRGDAETVRILLDHGARVDLVDTRGENALSMCTPGDGEARSLLVSAGATVAPAVPEPPTRPWPSVAPGRPDYTDPVAVVRGFIVELAEWERDAVARSAIVAAEDFPALFQQRDELAAVYLTDRVRAYRPHSFGTPTQADERETLHAIDYPKPMRCELLVRDPVDRVLRYERIYTVVKKRGEWRLDTLRSRPLGTTKWRRQLL